MPCLVATILPAKPSFVAWLSGSAKRLLPCDETLFAAARAVMLNGDFIIRPELADRAILLTLGTDWQTAPVGGACALAGVRARSIAHRWRAPRCGLAWATDAGAGAPPAGPLRNLVGVSNSRSKLADFDQYQNLDPEQGLASLAGSRRWAISRMTSRVPATTWPEWWADLALEAGWNATLRP
jgi:hypothetical protein